MPFSSQADADDVLVGAAKKVFAHLKDQWLPEDKGGKGFSTYWQLGHSFDTILDYFVHVDSSEAAAFPPIALEAYKRSLGNACWYDDYGWWGIAALKAAQHPGLFPDVSPFQTICNTCWATMHDNAPNVWANNKGDPAFAPLQPRVEGGVWNCDWSRPDGCGNRNTPPNLPGHCGGNAQGANLTGIQNTVTNGLYLVLASRLYEATGEADYRTAADREYGFLDAWFDVPDPETSLLRPMGVPIPGRENDVLVRERVATYRSGDWVCGYHPDLCWSGDQGIVVGGMIDRMIVEPGDNNPDSPAFRRAAAILQSVQYVTDQNAGGILQPWTTGQGGDPADYSTGVGVFMRYLLYADQRNAQMRAYTRSTAYRKLIEANVKSVVNAPIPDGLVPLTNSLAILVAGIVMLKT